MKRAILTLALLAPATAGAQSEPTPCERMGIYSTTIVGCPQYHRTLDLQTPFCEQPGLEDLAYLDSRCWQEVPFDSSKPCYAWDCPAPYDHVYVEPISGRTKTIRGSAEEIDRHYRAARQALGLQAEARTAAPAKCKGSKR